MYLNTCSTYVFVFSPKYLFVHFPICLSDYQIVCRVCISNMLTLNFIFHVQKFGQLEEKYNDENTLSDKVNSQDLANAVHLNASDRIELHNSAGMRLVKVLIIIDIMLFWCAIEFNKRRMCHGSLFSVVFDWSVILFPW